MANRVVDTGQKYDVEINIDKAQVTIESRRNQ